MMLIMDVPKTFSVYEYKIPYKMNIEKYITIVFIIAKAWKFASWKFPTAFSLCQ